MKVSTLFLTLALTSTSVLANTSFNFQKAKVQDVPTTIQAGTTNVEVPQHILFETDRSKSNIEFPKSTVRAYDPVGKKYYQEVMAGEAYKASILSSYHYWRYVTVYNVESVSERIAYLPYFEEECHDNSVFMAQWRSLDRLK